ncbi:hypothetical protein KIPB_011168, partial [Kipferlia bialata]
VCSTSALSKLPLSLVVRHCGESAILDPTPIEAAACGASVSVIALPVPKTEGEADDTQATLLRCVSAGAPVSPQELQRAIRLGTRTIQKLSQL